MLIVVWCMIKENKYILLSLYKSGEYITTEVCCLYHSTSHNFIYSTLRFCSQKKVAAGTLVLAPRLASNLTYKELWQQNEVKGILGDGNTGNRLIVVHAVSEASKYSPTQTEQINAICCCSNSESWLQVRINEW